MSYKTKTALLSFLIISACSNPQNSDPSKLKGNAAARFQDFLWPDPEHIPVCWEKIPDQIQRILPSATEVEAFKLLVEDTVVTQYRRAGLHLKGWQTCPDALTDPAIRIMISAHDGAFSEVGSKGHATWSSMVLDFPMNCGNECTPQSTAVHEFGHALGLFHESNRRDNRPEITGNGQCFESNQMGRFGQPETAQLGDYDPDSIMNYCIYDNEGWKDSELAILKDADIRTLRALYFEPLVEFKALPEPILALNTPISLSILGKDDRTTEYAFQFGKLETLDCENPVLYSAPRSLAEVLALSSGQEPGLHKLCILGAKAGNLVQSALSYTSIIWEVAPGPVLRLESLMEDRQYHERDLAQISIKNLDQITHFRYKWAESEKDCHTLANYSEPLQDPLDFRSAPRTSDQTYLCGLGQDRNGDWQKPEHASFWFLWVPISQNSVSLSFDSEEKFLPGNSTLQLKVDFSPFPQGRNDRAAYRYKLGHAGIDCQDEQGYLPVQSTNIPLTLDLRTWTSEQLSLCVVGGLQISDAPIKWQDFSTVVAKTWSIKQPRQEWVEAWKQLAQTNCDEGLKFATCEHVVGYAFSSGKNACEARKKLAQLWSDFERSFADPALLRCTEH